MPSPGKYDKSWM